MFWNPHRKAGEGEKCVRDIRAGRGCDMTYSLASGDLEDLSRKPDGALHAKLLVFGAVDEVIRDCPHTTSVKHRPDDIRETM